MVSLHTHFILTEPLEEAQPQHLRWNLVNGTCSLGFWEAGEPEAKKTDGPIADLKLIPTSLSFFQSEGKNSSFHRGQLSGLSTGPGPLQSGQLPPLCLGCCPITHPGHLALLCCELWHPRTQSLAPAPEGQAAALCPGSTSPHPCLLPLDSTPQLKHTAPGKAPSSLE